MTVIAKCYEDEVENALNFLSNKFGVPKESFKICDTLGFDPLEHRYSIKVEFMQTILFDTPEEVERSKYRVFKEEE